MPILVISYGPICPFWPQWPHFGPWPFGPFLVPHFGPLSYSWAPSKPRLFDDPLHGFVCPP